MQDARTTAIDGATIREAAPGSRIAPSRASEGSAPAFARGACPSLAAPMMTGDGLLVRLRPAIAGLTLTQLRQLADAAATNGNGIIEITARGNLQLRGMKPQTMPALSDEIVRAGIEPEIGVTIETPPLSGVDPEEVASARDMAANIRAAIAGLTAPLLLAPKLAIVVDGGGQIGLDMVTADIRLKAVRAPGEPVRWAIGLGGTAPSARFLGCAAEERAASVVLDLLKALANRGQSARGRDLDSNELAGLFPQDAQPMEAPTTGQSPLGIHRLASGEVVLGLRLGFGQIRAGELLAFADLAERNGAHEIRLAPGHAVLLLGLNEQAARAVQLAAANFGFSTDPADPAIHIAACAGAGACASGHYQTKPAATEFLRMNVGLLDGSIDVHFSGCPKGCAHASRAAITVVGTPTGYGLVVNGVASEEPVAYIGRNDLNRALGAVGRLVHDNKDAGESVNACFKRLSAADIVTALRQG
jgi:precorrin-3B synthase